MSLQVLDLSWASLTPKQLNLIAHELKDVDGPSLKNLNLSYNRLDFQSSDEDSAYSRKFLSNMRNFFQGARWLNHLNMSGMNIEQEELLQLCQDITTCPMLLALHLNDNGIVANEEFFLQVLDLFGMPQEEAHPLRKQKLFEQQRDRRLRGYGPTKKEEEQQRREFETRSMREAQGFKAKLRDYMRFSSPSKSWARGQKQGTSPQRAAYKSPISDILKKQTVNIQRAEVKDNILLGKQLKTVEIQKAISQCMIANGTGRFDDSSVDKFVITRILNKPELMFNQKPWLDQDYKARFFQKDWR